MNSLQLKMWLQHQQVLATLLLGAIVIFAVLFIPLSSLNLKRTRLEARIEGMRAQLAMKNYLRGEGALAEQKNEEQARNATLRNEWRGMVSRVSVFPKAEEESSVGHIDFKVKLFDVKQRVQRKARSLNIELPNDLGVDDTVHSDEDARKRMLQLRTVEKLVNLALDLKIVTIKSIVSLPPIRQETDGKIAFLEEYPVQMEFSGNLENVNDLLKGTIEQGNTFALKHTRIEANPKSDLLNVNVVFSSLVFMKDPNELPMTNRPAASRGKPMGY